MAPRTRSIWGLLLNGDGDVVYAFSSLEPDNLTLDTQHYSCGYSAVGPYPTATRWIP